jgi:hypothetical protein
MSLRDPTPRQTPVRENMTEKATMGPFVSRSQNSKRCADDDSYHAIGASGVSRREAAIGVRAEFGLHLDSTGALW